MLKTHSSLLPFLAALLVVGCAPGTRSVEAPEPRPLGRDLPSMRASQGDFAPERTAFVQPTGSLTLRDALVAALTNSPELATFSWEIRAKEAETLQAGLRPNPELGAEVENFGGTGGLGGFNGSEATIALSQIIELGGKRGKRLAVAVHEQNLAAWDYETARIDVLTETTKAFLQVLAVQEQLAVAEELVKVAEEVLASVSRRVKAGATSPVEENRARVELETSRIDRDRTSRALTAARKQLSAAWGATTPAFSEAAGSIEEVASPPSLEALQTNIEQSPVLARWTSELDYRQAALELERSRGAPDLSLGAGVRYLRDAEDVSLVVEFGVPLPIFDRNQGASRAAAMRVRRAEEDRRAAAVRIRTELAVSHEALLAAESEVQALRDRALPEAETAFQSAQDAYLRGSMRFTDVLDTERLLFELKSRYFGALARYHGTVADIERLTGESLETVRENSGRP
jgi:cobalt-zinc-cadmium efflux system outer membrane protein